MVSFNNSLVEVVFFCQNFDHDNDVDIPLWERNFPNRNGEFSLFVPFCHEKGAEISEDLPELFRSGKTNM